MAQDTYQTPPASLVRLVDAPATPTLSLGPDNATMLFMEPQNLPGIEELAEPELRLAGLRLNPRNFAPSRSRHFRKLSLQSIDEEKSREISGLPNDARIRNVSWSPDGLYIAFTMDRPDRIELYVAEVASGEARRLSSRAVHDVASGSPLDWFPDSRRLLVRTVPEDLPEPPTKPLAPEGPILQENSGEKAAARTYQDLLKNAYDEAVFEHYMTSQLAIVDLDSEVQTLGPPNLYLGSEPSPSGEYILRQTIHRPFSYLVPAYRFPKRIEVIDPTGNLAYQVTDLPLFENVPTAFGSVPTGVRSIDWRPDRPATLYWTEAQDEGDAAKEAEVRDEVFFLDAPFTASKSSLVKLPLRYGGITWGNDNLALVSEFWWSSRQRRMYQIDPATPEQPPAVLFDVSMEDRYNDPGSPVTTATPEGGRILLTSNRGRSIFWIGTGASPEGNRPFLKEMNLRNQEVNTLFRSEAPYYEYPVALADRNTLLVRRESPDETPNFFARNLKKGNMRALTDFDHPYPEFSGINKELLVYNREDGVQLSATLYTPPGYTSETDGALPTLLWAYPREFKSADNAGQLTDSPYRFKSIRYSGAIPYVTQGYAILDQTAMPVIGEGEEEPNDTFVKQLVMNAEAAIEAGAETGAVDPDRVAIAGHSYGAFMTANLLAHSDLFRAGIARSGAYNRSLTPFGFQREERTFWEAPEIYFAMSPFMHADDVNEPILLIHGEADNNSGTFPIQSIRYYNALKGHGKTARLVMLPHESHGYRARESVLHMMWETHNWLERYVKPEKPEVKEPVG